MICLLSAGRARVGSIHVQQLRNCTVVSLEPRSNHGHPLCRYRKLFWRFLTLRLLRLLQLRRPPRLLRQGVV